MISIQAILRVVAQVYDLSVETLTSDTRRAHVVEARQAAMLVLRDNRPDLSLQVIVHAVGRTDHTTAIYGIQTHRDRCEVNAEAAIRLTRILQLINNLQAPAPIRQTWGPGLWWYRQTAPSGAALAA